MHRARVKSKVTFGGTVLEPTYYLLEDTNAAELLSMEACSLDNSFVELPQFTPLKDWNDRSILVVRPGGFGDILFLTPVLREIRRIWPKSRVSICCFPRYANALAGNPNVFEVVEYPVKCATASGYDAVVWLENVIEKNPMAKKHHAVDVMADQFGIRLNSGTMDYFMSATEVAEAMRDFPKKGKRRVGIQVYASAQCRTYPVKQMVEAGKLLLEKGFEIFLFGSPGQIHCDNGPSLTNLTSLKPHLSFRGSCAVLTTCDALIAPDSALLHIGGIIGIPTVALFGPFPWFLRTSYSPSIHALSGNGRCAPCFHHVLAGIQFPKDGPCRKSGVCDVLADISPRRIAAKVESLLE